MNRRTLSMLGMAAALLMSLAGAAFAQDQDNPGPWLPYAASDYSDRVDLMYRVIFWVTTGMFLLTEGLLILFCIQYRRRPGHRPTYTHGSNKAEITWTVIPALMLLGIALWQIPHWNHIKKADWNAMAKEPDTTVVDILGEQFKWNVRYPGSKAKYGGDSDYTNLSNVHMPFGNKALFNLRSKDVIHSVFIPHMRVKQDTVPGLRQRLWFKPNRMFLVRLKNDDGTPAKLTESGTLYVEEGPDKKWVEKPRKVQEMVWIYHSSDATRPAGSLTEKDFEAGGKLFDKKIAASGINYWEKDGLYELVHEPGKPPIKKARVLHQGKLADGQEWADCHYAMGIFEIACAELCGLGHGTMRAFLVVEPRVSYEKWISTEAEDASDPSVAWKFWRN